MQAWNTLKTTVLLATLTGLLIVVGSALVEVLERGEDPAKFLHGLKP